MMLKLALIRHGKTFGNTQGRYIGTTDEPLCQEGIDALREKAAEYPAAELVFASPMKRCIQTAEVLYPGMEPYRLPDFRECDFGEFENKNYQELSGSGGRWLFPGVRAGTRWRSGPSGLSGRCWRFAGRARWNRRRWWPTAARL